MAELVDALVSNTSGFTSMPVRSRLWVQKKSDLFKNEGCFFCYFNCNGPNPIPTIFILSSEYSVGKPFTELATIFHRTIFFVGFKFNRNVLNAD